MNDLVSTASLYSGGYLAHYGIKGQKWGIRRFQNSDGSLTAEGIKRYGSEKELKKAVRKEYREDNAKAFKLGNAASSASWAAKRQSKTLERANKRLEKDPTNEKKRIKRDLEAKAAKILKNMEKITRKEAEDHYNSLTKKYGKTAMKDIRYAKDGRIDEINKKALGLSIMSAIGAAATMAVGGVGVIVAQPSNREVGERLRDITRSSVRTEYRATQKI